MMTEFLYFEVWFFISKDFKSWETFTVICSRNGGTYRVLHSTRHTI